MLTAREVAALLRVAVSTVYQMCDRGVLPCVRVGSGARRRGLRVEAAAVENFIAGGGNGAAAPAGRPRPVRRAARRSSAFKHLDGGKGR